MKSVWSYWFVKDLGTCAWRSCPGLRSTSRCRGHLALLQPVDPAENVLFISVHVVKPVPLSFFYLLYEIGYIRYIPFWADVTWGPSSQQMSIQSSKVPCLRLFGAWSHFLQLLPAKNTSTYPGHALSPWLSASNVACCCYFCPRVVPKRHPRVQRIERKECMKASSLPTCHSDLIINNITIK